MHRAILLLTLTLLIAKMPSAQTLAEIDSLKAEVIKHLKDLPKPSDSQIRAYEQPSSVIDP